MTILIKSRVIACTERFQTVMKDRIAYGSALTESQAAEATEEVSIGYWLVVEGWPAALSLGPSKPLPPNDFAKGDPVEIRISKGNA